MDSTMCRHGKIEKETRIACRAIVADDEDAVLALLCAGFPERSADYWSAAMSRLARRRVPEGLPRFGYCLTADDRIVGVLLLIYTAPLQEDDPIRCCVSSWYVESRYRIYASALAKVALKQKDCSYINMSSALHTREGLIAQGYSCYAQGQFLALPALGPGIPGVAVHRVERDTERLPDDRTRGLLLDHAEAGCISLSCVCAGVASSFVFLKRRLRRVPLPYAQLIYCESVDSFVRLQGPIGRHLMGLGLPWVMLDANGPVKGLYGFYLDHRMPKYYKGFAPPRLGDLSYTEAALFGP